MSEPTNAEMERLESQRLDEQIDEYLTARYYAATGNLPYPPDEDEPLEAPPVLVEVEDV